MSGSQSSEKGFNPSNKDSFDVVYALAKGHATCFLPFLRKNFGSEALGIPGLIAFILMLLVGGLGRIPEMSPFLGVWIIAMAYQRASTMRAMRRGVIRHSRYEGDVDTKVIKSRATVKQFLEPLVCVTAWLCFEQMGFSHNFAMFFAWGAVSMALVAMIDRQLDNKRLEAMRDAEIEQRHLAARYRGEID
jgi:hypothetical protein